MDNNINKITGREALIKALIDEGVDIIFGYPGGQIIPVFDCLYDYKDRINHILVRHEQAATHAAQGYARTSGRVGVALVTSGPGATNTITGIADAMLDSTPIVVIAGQVPSSLLGSDAFQEADVVGITQPVSKWSYQIRRAEDIPSAVAKAFYIASTGRPGPVVLDITKDAQNGMLEYKFDKKVFIRSYQPKPDVKEQEIEVAANMINAAKKPLALIGQGVILGNAEKELLAFLEKSGVPAASTILGLSAIPSSHPQNVGMLGMHGNIGPNLKTNECDVLIAIGMRFDDRVTGDLETYAKQAQIIHFDIDKAEINKNVPVTARVLGDVKDTLPMVTNLLEKKSYPEWMDEFKSCYQREYDVVINSELHPQSGQLKMGEVINKVSEATGSDGVLVTDVGQHQMMAVRYFKYFRSRSVVTSGGLGTMGFGLPAAIGAKYGAADRTICLFVGDGGIQMTIQELGTIMQYGINVKIILLNNHFLGMVRQWQELFFDERYSETVMTNPDFVKIAEAYDIKSERVAERSDLDNAIKRMLEHDGAYLLDVQVETKGMVYPMVPAGGCVTNILLGNE
ncbi:biosynthetic-type acetolactate synthase large subunit [Dysgonomonas sp. 511]|uniref:biosynthetic-type acetolactate synthase large subunit n=1 Tax=Dysgonomonas sp. 511 TaxID=2302930 RepID=UPI0013D0F4E2|nr:biosynthetic-type acetolactate synthase large subunit [Dysgonomonas sp. 511]NDV79675.1 biosynthetic-type acetolactate synthase large subunit [Dysgonomonas sp. 511]